MDFKGKNVLITGGSREIGYATAAEFVKSGARVVIIGRDEVQLSRAAESIGAYALKWDIADISIREKKLNHAYALSKYAIRGLTTGLGKAMAPYGICVNAVAPRSLYYNDPWL